MFKKTISAMALTAAMASTNAMAYEESKHDGFTKYGDIAQYTIPAIGGGLALLQGDFEGFWQNAEGALWTAGITHAMKFGFDETRPNGGSHSFPSGHTSAAMQGAAFMWMRYGWEVGLPSTIAAAGVGASRVHGNYHYTRDVIAGTAIAWGVQYLITEAGISPTEMVIKPVITGDFWGISGGWRF